jgi:hypothetical protein
MLLPLNSVQINVVSVLDAGNALSTQTLESCLFMMDNSVDADGNHSAGQGTPQLSTTCAQGQVINWIIYSIGGATARISKIHFVDQDICANLQIYGQPAVAVSPSYLPGLTPIYDYWSGIVLPYVPPGRYPYRMQIQIGETFLCVDSPSLNVQAI